MNKPMYFIDEGSAWAYAMLMKCSHMVFVLAFTVISTRVRRKFVDAAAEN